MMGALLHWDMILGGMLCVSNIFVAMALFRLHKLLWRIYLSGILTGHIDHTPI